MVCHDIARRSKSAKWFALARQAGYAKFGVNQSHVKLGRAIFVYLLQYKPRAVHATHARYTPGKLNVLCNFWQGPNPQVIHVLAETTISAVSLIPVAGIATKYLQRWIVNNVCKYSLQIVSYFTNVSYLRKNVYNVLPDTWNAREIA